MRVARLSTHVLDLELGRPAAGLRVDLYRLGAAREHLAGTLTNADGRTDAPLLGEASPGIYELVFQAGAYLRASGRALSDPPFLNEIVIRFGVSEGENYHVPLLLSAHGYSTYRGS